MPDKFSTALTPSSSKISVIKTFAPSSKNREAIEAPIPLEPPDIKSVFPFSSLF